MWKLTQFVAILIFIVFIAAKSSPFASDASLQSAGPHGEAVLVSAYTVADVRWTMDPLRPATLRAVQFSVTPGPHAPDPTFVRVSLTEPPRWYICNRAAGYVWECNTRDSLTGLTIAAVTKLNVLALSGGRLD